jgi:hypothetical protein
MRDDTCLTGACAGKKKHRTIHRCDAFALLRIHVCEKVGHTFHFSL